MTHPTTNYKQSLFDKAFVDVIEFLFQNKRNIPKLSTKKALLESLDINPANYVEIKNGNRGVPTLKIDYVIEQLTTHWDINKNYFKSRQGAITKTPLGDGEQAHVEFKSLSERYKLLEKDLEKEKAVNAELRNMIDLLRQSLNLIKPK